MSISLSSQRNGPKRRSQYVVRQEQRTSNAANAVHDAIDHLLANGVVATGVVVGSILLATDKHLRVEKRAIGTSADLVDRRGVQINEERSRNMLAAAGLVEESLEGTRVTDILEAGVRTTIGAEAVLEKVTMIGLLADTPAARNR